MVACGNYIPLCLVGELLVGPAIPEQVQQVQQTTLHQG